MDKASIILKQDARGRVHTPVEPTWMVLGQSSSVAAAMAVKQGKTLHDLPVSDLQAGLRKVGQVLDLSPEHLAAAAAPASPERVMR